MKKLLRWLGFHVHEWGPWEPSLLGSGFYSTMLQRRQCVECGKVEEWWV